jgi:hypothetical protein
LLGYIFPTPLNDQDDDQGAFQNDEDQGAKNDEFILIPNRHRFVQDDASCGQGRFVKSPALQLLPVVHGDQCRREDRHRLFRQIPLKDSNGRPNSPLGFRALIDEDAADNASVSDDRLKEAENGGVGGSADHAPGICRPV